ncbi:MAG: hypothetical protein CFH43_00040 [Proteobacteria bacterium]|nr:MAG: hypothetical protein CFH43_00040 [Pseudomonadota bacterium]
MVQSIKRNFLSGICLCLNVFLVFYMWSLLLPSSPETLSNMQQQTPSYHYILWIVTIINFTGILNFFYEKIFAEHNSLVWHYTPCIIAIANTLCFLKFILMI